MWTDIRMIIEYACGCKECVYTSVDVPKSLLVDERTDETDRKLIAYLEEEYDISKLCCSKRHRYKESWGVRIVEIL